MSQEQQNLEQEYLEPREAAVDLSSSTSTLAKRRTYGNGGGLAKKTFLRGVSKVAQKPPHFLKKAAIPAQTEPIEKSKTVVASLSDSASSPMTNEELISRAKHHIGTGETSRNISFRAAADDIKLACDQGAKQCEVAEGVGKSAAWVNRLLKWREGGYVGAPFSDKILQGVKNDPAALEPPSIEPAAPTILAETNATTTGVEGAINAAAAAAPATKMLSAACAPYDYHLPQELNRQDPERAFQRLAEQWSSIAFHNLFLDSPQAAQLRFLCDVVLPEVGGAEAFRLFLAGDRSPR